MITKVLGSAAGGGFPQWNCACDNCSRFRKSTFKGKSRTQSQLAVSGDGKSWHLMNASPDLRLQLEQNQELQPGSGPPNRQTPIRSIVLTNADLDHVLGLLLMRESQPLHIYSTEPVQNILLEDNSFFRMLRQFEGQTRWSIIHPRQEFELESLEGEKSGVLCEPIPMGGGFPRYVAPERLKSLSALPGSQPVVGLLLRSKGSEKRVGYFPGVGRLEPELLAAFERCQCLFFDGTFWTDDELIRVQGAAKTALEMGHIPLSGSQGSLELLAHLKSVKKYYIHINNTNPILDEASQAYELVQKSGWQVAHDGLQLEV